MSPETGTILVHRNKTIEKMETNCTSTKLPKEKKTNNNCDSMSNGKVLDDTVFKQSTNTNDFIDQINVKEEAHHDSAHQDIGTDWTFKRQVVWFNAIGFLVLHLFGLHGLAIMGLGKTHPATIAYFVALTFLSGMGITMGAHRLFTHRSYKAKTWLRVVLLWMHTMAGQNCLYVWVRDHRQHHKYSDTDADPHNATRGFFFSHVGWLMSKKHPKVIEYGQKIDMSDLEADPWIMFQKKYYKLVYTIFTLIVPTAIPCLLWDETVLTSMFATFFARYIVQLNFTWSVNSAAHMFGNKPYDKDILSAESTFVSLIAGGEGWHNYHHTFPWDYRTAELGMPYNLTTKIIDFFARKGAIFDRKTVSHNLLRSRIMRTGDGTHHIYGTEAMAKQENDDVDEGATIDSNGLRKYIVEKNRINKLMIDELEKLNQVKADDLNNNNNESYTKAKLNNNDWTNSASTSVTKDKQALNINA